MNDEVGSSRKADVSKVGKQLTGCTRSTCLLGSGFKIEETENCPFPVPLPEILAPVTCCTICRKLSTSAVMYVVDARFEARGLRFTIFLLTPPPPPLRRFIEPEAPVEAASFSDPPENVGPDALAVKNGEPISPVGITSSFPSPVYDFCRTFVKVSVSLAKISVNHESLNAERKPHCSIVMKLSEDAIFASPELKN
uniref:Uncharacterized protein n=1 Tax=Solanum lycopersicum TaxID=4081 RepID=A0A3Q7ILD1_SOLLC